MIAGDCDELVQNPLFVRPAARSISLDNRFNQFQPVAMLTRPAIYPPNQDDNNAFIPGDGEPIGNKQREAMRGQILTSLDTGIVSQEVV